jgi:hypothetical protein
MSLYRSIVRQSFIIAWKHKYLWVFGLFATLLASNFEIELINRFTNRQGATLYDWERWAQTGIFSPRAWGNMLELLKTDTGSTISLLVVLLVLVALFIALLWLSVVSQGALVNNAQKALANGSRLPSATERKHDTSTGFKEGRKHFWQLLGVNVIVRALVYLLALVTIAPIATPGNLSVAMSLLYFIIFIVLLAVALTLAFITKYAIAFIVLKNHSMGSSIVAGWKLFRDNWLVSLEMTFILFAISIIGSLAIILAVMIMAIPVALLYILSVVFGSFPIFLAVLVLGVLISIAVVVIGGSILTVVQTTAWVSLFTQLIGNKAPSSKLERVFGNIM